MTSIEIRLMGIFIFMTSILESDSQFISQRPLRKTFWAKRITDSLFVAGRLSDVQIKYASEDGFKSVISLYNHTATGNFGSKQLVPTKEAEDIAERLSGLDFSILCNESHDDDEVDTAWWRKKEAVDKFNELYSSSAKPVLLYSNTGYSAAFIALAWLMWQTRLGNIDDLNYQTSPERFYERASGLGYDFTEKNDLKMILEELSGQKFRCEAKKPALTKPDWHKHYWWAKPVEKNWYITGQILSSQLELIKKFNPDVVINTRKAPTYTNPETDAVSQTQEEVTLLNINDKCSTYGCQGGRQSETQLLANRINPNKSSEYVGPDNTNEVNYQSRNPLEFGDDIGYNETLERLAMKNESLEYLHTPIGGHLGYHETMYRLYNQSWRDAHTKGDVFIHCRTGYRAVIPTLMTLGLIMEKDMDWAIAKGKLVGYSFTEQTDLAVWNLFKFAFNNTKPSGPSPVASVCPEDNENGTSTNSLSNGASSGTSIKSLSSLVWLILVTIALLT